jgi:hypothetical protein
MVDGLAIGLPVRLRVTYQNDLGHLVCSAVISTSGKARGQLPVVERTSIASCRAKIPWPARTELAERGAASCCSADEMQQHMAAMMKMIQSSEKPMECCQQMMQKEKATASTAP